MVLKQLKKGFQSHKTRSYEWRRDQLKSLHQLLETCESDLLNALHQDLGKSNFEGYTGEVGLLRSEVRYALKNLSRWMKPLSVPTPLAHQPAKSAIHREPLGVVLIIGPWNYPVQLAFAPLIGAIAAGNCAVIKPSELAPHTSALLAKIIPQFLDAECVSVVEGGSETTQKLLAEKFDHIFFTGSPRVGRIVMEAAAKNLTPITLELGGKSPCIVDNSVNLDLAAKRIAWGKLINAGQTCIAPDYVLVNQEILEPFMQKYCAAVSSLYGKNPRQSPDYGRIINADHVQRLVSLLDGQKPYWGGEHDVSDRYFSPTLLSNVDPDSKVMRDEIFGPILPVLPIAGVDDAIRFINDREKPLSLYLFTNNRESQDRVLTQTSSGGVCLNDTVSHVAIPGLPFGGTGTSGMGSYHGEAGFNAFSHRKAVFTKSTLIDIPLRYPPYNKGKLDVVRWFL